MSHSIQQCWTNGTGTVVIIIDYATGGEAVSLNEVWTNQISGVIMGTISPNDNSLGIALLPMIVNGKIMLFKFAGSTFVEIPATTALNAKVSAIVLGATVNVL
jgi:hypothetical protein